MKSNRTGQIAVIFTSVLSGADLEGYARAAAAMETLAAAQPGYAGFISTRGGDGFGISISYWADDNAAKAWRDHPDHAAIRERGRAIWYSSYTIDVARIERGYDWSANA
jgi:heme-degrading monooxygenase HmoA